MDDDYQNMGMDAQTKRYFKKIVNSFSWGLIWMLFITFFGLYLRMAYIHSGLNVINITFFAIAFISFCFLIRFYYRTWKD